jgi:hypothetical protein
MRDNPSRKALSIRDGLSIFLGITCGKCLWERIPWNHEKGGTLVPPMIRFLAAAKPAVQKVYGTF